MIGALPSSGTEVKLACTVSGSPAYAALAESEWHITLDPTLQDASAFTDGGYSDMIACLHNAKGTLKGKWNANQILHGAPYNITDGVTLQTLGTTPNFFYALVLATTSANNAFAYVFPTIIVGPINVDANIKDPLELAFEFNNRGVFFYGYPG